MRDANNHAADALVSDRKQSGFLVYPAHPNLESLTVFQRIAGGDRTAVKDCLDAYGNLVWALAKKITASREEAENAASEIFLAIWKYAGRFDPFETNETDFIVLLARRQFIINNLCKSMEISDSE